MEVRAICSAEDERKVKILLENSDVTKTIAWATSGNSGRRMTPLDSSRKLNSANDSESPFYTRTDAANYFLGKDFTVEQIERYLKRKGYSDEWIRNMFDLMDEYADEQEDFDSFLHCRSHGNRVAMLVPLIPVPRRRIELFTGGSLCGFARRIEFSSENNLSHRRITYLSV